MVPVEPENIHSNRESGCMNESLCSPVIYVKCEIRPGVMECVLREVLRIGFLL